MNPTSTELQATVKERFAKVARSPDQERKFPVGPASAKKLGYAPKEIDSLPTAAHISNAGRCFAKSFQVLPLRRHRSGADN